LKLKPYGKSNKIVSKWTVGTKPDQSKQKQAKKGVVAATTPFWGIDIFQQAN